MKAKGTHQLIVQIMMDYKREDGLPTWVIQLLYLDCYIHKGKLKDTSLAQ